MKTLKFLLLSLHLVLLLTTKALATAQARPMLIYEGDTLALAGDPLYSLHKGDYSFFKGLKGCITTGCWIGYTSEWIIKDNSLYLKSIKSCCFYQDSVQSDLKKLFGNKVVDGLVKATWVTDTLLAGKGKIVFYIHQGYQSLYEKDIEFYFNKGEVFKVQEHDNSKSKRTVFTENLLKFRSYVMSKINWDKIPVRKGDTIKISVLFSADVEGKIDTVKVSQGYSKKVDREVIRAIKTVPEWEVYYRHGVFRRDYWPLRFAFTEDVKKAFNRKPNM